MDIMAYQYFVIVLIFYFHNVSGKPHFINGDKNSNELLKFVVDNVNHDYTDPEVEMNTSQLISSKGYPSEEHDVITRDGYILGIQRIPHGRDLKQTDNKPVVLYLRMPDMTYGWETVGEIPMAEGTRLLALTMTNFGILSEILFDDMALYDLPATVDKIIAVTGVEQIYYVGHSQGSTTAFAGLLQSKDLASKIKLVVALAPVTYLSQIKTPLRFISILSDDRLYDILGKKDFSSHSDTITRFGKEVCGHHKNPSTAFLCETALFLIGGFNYQQLNESRFPVYLGHFPAGTSVQNMIHISQGVKTDKFQMMDFGIEGNMGKYNQSTPPVYNLKDIDTPVALYSATADWIAVKEDVELLAGQLNTSLVVRNVQVKGWEHFDFIWGMNAFPACYLDMLQLFLEHL